MHDAALIGEGHVGACEDVVGDGLAEDFDAEDVGDSGNVCQLSCLDVDQGWACGAVMEVLTSLPSLARCPDVRVLHGHCNI